MDKIGTESSEPDYPINTERTEFGARALHIHSLPRPQTSGSLAHTTFPKGNNSYVDVDLTTNDRGTRGFRNVSGHERELVRAHQEDMVVESTAAEVRTALPAHASHPRGSHGVNAKVSAGNRFRPLIAAKERLSQKQDGNEGIIDLTGDDG